MSLPFTKTGTIDRLMSEDERSAAGERFVDELLEDLHDLKACPELLEEHLKRICEQPGDVLSMETFRHLARMLCRKD